MASLRPWSIAGWAARNQGRQVAPMPWFLDSPCPGNWMPRFIATSAIKPPMDLGANGSGHQATKIVAIPRRRGRQAAAGNSAPPSHRPPWSLALMGPSLTRHFHLIDHLGPLPESVPRCLRPQAPHRTKSAQVTWSPVGRPAKVFDASRSPEDLGAKRSQSASDAKVPSLYRGPRSHGRLGPRSTKGLMAARDPVADGESAGLIHRGTSDRGASTDLVPRRSRHRPHPGPMPPRSPWSHDQLDTKAALSTKMSGYSCRIGREATA